MSEQTPLTIYELENDYTYHCDDYARRNIIDNLRHKSREEQDEIIADLMYDKVITDNLNPAKHCEVCGKAINEGYYFEEDGTMYCSDECLDAADLNVCSTWKGGETMKKFKVVRRFPMDPPVIEKSFDTKEEADAYVEDAREKESRVSGVMGMKASFSVETGELNYESEEETE